MKVYLIEIEIGCEDCGGGDIIAVCSELNKCRDFCIDFVKEKNKAWENFDMNNADIIEDMRKTNIGTWKLIIRGYTMDEEFEIREMDVL
jgi:hypothetical protein